MKRDIVDQLLEQWADERPGTDASALGVVVRIQLAAKLLMTRSSDALDKHGLKHWEYDVLSVLRRQGSPFELAATDIADSVMLTSGAMTTRIDGLENRGLVRRQPSKQDRRSVLVRLTAKGKKLVDEAVTTRLNDANAVLAEIPPRDLGQLENQLRQLVLGLHS